MADKIIGYGTLVKLGSTAQGEVRSVTPPPQTRERIAIDDLDSTIRVEAAGIEDISDISFTQLYEPGDTNHALVDTEFTNRSSSAWSIVYPVDSSGSATQTLTFNAVVMAIEVAEVSNADVISRSVTLNRQGDITTS